jgi:protein SCO1/2
MRSKINYFWLLLLVPVILVVWFFISFRNNRPLRVLPYYGPKNALKVNDTVYHSVPPFEFTDQYNEKINSDSVKGKIYVAEYFFTTCQSICPVMNDNLQKVYSMYRSKPDFLILSHTVDPENDSVPVLLNYAKEHYVTDRKWLFLTGDKAALYNLARKGYLLSAGEGNGGAEDFIHTQNFALVDKERHIRGFYDGTNAAEVDRLIQDIKLLLMEYEYLAKNNS